jgi:glyoxylase-like metal-dependent hydrolase (beta-lactamase superfamily II)
MKIIPISLPTPFRVGDVNVYLIAEEPLTLIDTGPKTAEAVHTLKEKLASHGYKLSDIRRIVLTHAHEDHCGLSKTIRDAAGKAEIFVHGWETGHLFGRLDKDEHRSLVQRAGVPDSVWHKMQEFYEFYRPLTDALEDGDFQLLNDEQELEFNSGVIKVIHTPGHTPGSCSFVREANRTIFCGDCVLKRITPNPVLSPDPVDPSRRFNSLAEYQVSLARIRSFAPTLIYGGHQEPITDFDEIFHRYVRTLNERQSGVLSHVTDTGVTAWDVAKRLFPDASRDESQLFLALSEAVAHLHYAETENRIDVEIKNGVEFYRKK